MDKEAQKRSYAWLPQFMPTVARLIRERRAKDGDAWVNECWRRGVVQGEPGWFWAAEGALAVGVPLHADVVLAYHQARAAAPSAAVLDMRVQGAGHAA